MKPFLGNIDQFTLYSECQKILLYTCSNCTEHLTTYQILPIDCNKDTCMRGHTICGTFSHIIQNSFQLDTPNIIHQHFRITVKFAIFPLRYIFHVV